MIDHQNELENNKFNSKANEKLRTDYEHYKNELNQMKQENTGFERVHEEKKRESKTIDTETNLIKEAKRESDKKFEREYNEL